MWRKKRWGKEAWLDSEGCALFSAVMTGVTSCSHLRRVSGVNKLTQRQNTHQTERKGRRFFFFLPSYCQSAEISTIQQEGERRNKKVGKKTEGNVLNIRQHHCRRAEASINTERFLSSYLLHLRPVWKNPNKRSLLVWLDHSSMNWLSWLSGTTKNDGQAHDKRKAWNSAFRYQVFDPQLNNSDKPVIWMVNFFGITGQKQWWMARQAGSKILLARALIRNDQKWTSEVLVASLV